MVGDTYVAGAKGVLPCRTGLRTETSIIAETSQAFSTHHIAVLVGYGAHAVVPYLAFETCRQWRASPRWVCPYKWRSYVHDAEREVRMLMHCRM